MVKATGTTTPVNHGMDLEKELLAESQYRTFLFLSQTMQSALAFNFLDTSFSHPNEPKASQLQTSEARRDRKEDLHCDDWGSSP